MPEGTTYKLSESGPPGSLSHSLSLIHRRVLREGSLAVEMLERALSALWSLNVDAAQAVRRTDDQIDTEEVAIELACNELLALHRPIARDLRLVTFALRVNANFERVGDHASSLARVATRLASVLPKPAPGEALSASTALLDLGARVPAMSHDLLRAIADLDVERARVIVRYDPTIDAVEKRVLTEVLAFARARGRDDDAVQAAILLSRAGRELERVGDLMSATAEDLIYLLTGEIVRHAKRRSPKA